MHTLSINHTQKRQPRKSLGTLTKTSSPIQKIERLSNRFTLQAHAQKLLKGFRVGICQKHIKPSAGSVGIVNTGESAKFEGLMQCGSVWTCPHCMARINANRAKALKRGLQSAEFLGYSASMLTLTVQHTRADLLTDLLDGLTKAYKYLMSGKGGMIIRDLLRWVGSARALEIRYGKNGFHPHFHVVILSESKLNDADRTKAQKYIAERWVKALSHVGLSASVSAGTDLRESYDRIFDYLTKADKLSAELTGNNIKTESDSDSPLDLLERGVNGDKFADSVFQEYAIATKGCKALVMCKAFRELTEYDSYLEQTENDSDNPESVPDIIASIDIPLWRVIRANPRDIRGDMLYHAKIGGYRALCEFIAGTMGIEIECILAGIHAPIKTE